MAQRVFSCVCAAATLTCLLAAPPLLFAQASLQGPSFGVAGGWGTIRRPDVAFDPANNVYLVVSGNMTHGRFVSADGAPIGAPFYIPGHPAYNQSSRVAYSPHLGGFLVTWLDTRANPNFNQIYGRLVRFGAGGAPAFVTGDILIGNPVPATHPEMAPAVCYSTVSQRFLVVFQQYGPPGGPTSDIRGQFVANDGQLIGGQIVFTFDNHFQGEPGIGYNPATDDFLVAWQNYYEPAGPATVQVRRINAATGALGGAADIVSAARTNVPQVEYNPARNQFFVAWNQNANMFFGRFVNADGSPAGNISTVAVNYNSYDGLGMSYNPVSGSFFTVFHGRAPTGFPQEDVGAQISSDGAPDVEFVVTQTGSTLGNFNPRVVASSTRKEWMLVTSTGFAQVTAQRIKTNNGGAAPPPPPPPGPPPPPPGGTVIDLSQAGTPNGSWFFAEGAASGTQNGFHTYYLIANEHDAAVRVRAYFSRDDGRTVERQFDIAPRSRSTVSLLDVAGPGSFGAVFQSLTPGANLLIERSMYWGANWEGSTSEVATDTLSTHWYFAEGSRGGEFFRNYYLIYNPTQVANSVVAYFVLPNGYTVVKDLVVGPQQRATIDANTIPELAGQDFSCAIISTGYVVAERAMYWGPGWVGGTAAMGARQWSGLWEFAEGAAGPGFDTFYPVFNPNQHPVTVYATMMPEFGAPFVRAYTVPGYSRFTIYLNQEVGHIGGVATQFKCASPILVERSTYWGAGWVEGSTTAGTPSPWYTWFLPEGTAGGTFDTFLLLSNSHEAFGSLVTVTLYVEGVGRFTLHNQVYIAPRGRQTLYMNQTLRDLEAAEGLAPGTLAGKSFSTKVTATAGAPIVAEHAVYLHRDGSNYWRGGGASMGIAR